MALAAVSVLAWPYVAIPSALMVAWLVACRLMVRRERGVSGPLSRIPTVPVAAQAQAAEVAEEADGLSEDTAEVAVAAPGHSGVSAAADLRGGVRAQAEADQEVQGSGHVHGGGGLVSDEDAG